MNYVTNAPSDHLLRTLSGLRGRHVAVFPNTGNAGDGFIMYATLWLLKYFDIEYELFGANETVFGRTVLFGGGGNLISNTYDTMRRTICDNIEKNECILLPHTVVGASDLLDWTAGGKLSVLFRDPISYENALVEGLSPEVCKLAHDMTFYLPSSLFAVHRKRGSGIAYCLRDDEERHDELQYAESIDLSLSWNGHWWTNEALCRASTYSLASSIAPFSTVVTDRLHIGILAAMLGKRVMLGANNYYKNEAVFNYSLRPRYPRVSFHESRFDLISSASACDESDLE